MNCHFRAAIPKHDFFVDSLNAGASQAVQTVPRDDNSKVEVGLVLKTIAASSGLITFIMFQYSSDMKLRNGYITDSSQFLYSWV
jgi:hypothetical protein